MQHPSPKSLPQLAVLLAIGGTLAASAQMKPAPVGTDRPNSVPPHWEQFRGPNRDGVSAETGLLREWPAGGPPLRWRRQDLGRGYSSPILTPHGIFITGDVGEDLIISALDRDGRPRWRTTNGRSWKRSHPGARSTCTYDGGDLFHLNAHGRLVCLDPATGKERWAVNVLERFEGENIRWGISECLLLDGDRVIVTPGGKRALMAALDRRTGETVWRSEPLSFLRTRQVGGKLVDPPVRDTDRAGYASPVLLEIGGRRLLFSASASHYFCVDADSGRLLWTFPVPVRWEVIGAIPVLCPGDRVFFTAPDNNGRLFQVKVEGTEVVLTSLWETPVDNCHGGLVQAAGRLYGSGYRQFKGWTALELATGAMCEPRKDIAKGSALFADQRLYALGENGVLHLLELSPEGLETRGTLTVGAGKQRDVWAHPVLLNGRLYLRRHDTLYCYDVSRP